MKNFLTSFLGALAALVLFVMGGTFLLFLIAVGIAAASKQKQVVVEPGSYLVFNTSTNITDAPPPFNAAQFFHLVNEQDQQNLQLRQVTRALQSAATDSRIAGVYITGRFEPSGYGDGLAALKEVREAVEKVRAAGKPVVAYLDFAMTRDLYIASAASEIYLDPFGEIFMPGMATEPMFYAGAFEKYGIGVQVTRVGKYKSYVEPFIRQDMSPENREQTQKLLDDLWGSLTADIAQARGISVPQLQTVVDTEGMIRADQALKAKLVTKLGYRDEVYSELKSRTGRTGPHTPFKQVSLADYSSTLQEDHPSNDANGAPIPGVAHGDAIGVVYAEGAIVDGKGEQDDIGAERFSRELRRMREDPEIKAIVLRVNSPGGSATAAEDIQREIRLARKTKPVIVSMGAYAASGGYWISAESDRIFAEPTTITGSIGVFGIFMDAQKLLNNFGLTFDRVKTGKYADVMTISRPKTPDELAIFQHSVDWIYDQFIRKVANGRKLDRAKVEEIAQGRVWSGTEAKNLGLVDEMGGLADAIRYAAKKANLGEKYRLSEYPKRMEFAEALAEAMQGNHPFTSKASSGLVSKLTNQLSEEARTLEQFNAPTGVYARMPSQLVIK